MNILLQILDDGRITDAGGRTVNFENTVLIMTTNAGSAHTTAAVGFSGDEQSREEQKTEKALSSFLRPEFINRIDEIITFRSLDEQDFVSIARIMLDDLKTALAEKEMAFYYTDEAADFIAKNSFSHKYGARNMRRYIQKNVEDPLAERMIASCMMAITQVRLSVQSNALVIDCM
jgi:ATP-dependent Clp protease ATP-binding subunit ClpA